MVANTLTGPQQRIDFAYDWQGRRVSKRVWNNTAGTGTLAADRKFVYDGWNLIAELNATNNAVIRSFIWGLDLSGSLQGAGGVGGLLAVNDAVNGMHFPAFDGNGNVAALVAAQSSTVSALYEHGPFGEILRATGPMATANPFRFSTKFRDDETGLLYYGYRYYDPITGRWYSRDPIEERGSKSPYSFVDNLPVTAFDIDGRMTLREFPWELQQSPTRDYYKDYDGLTWFNKFEPDATVYKSVDGPCCWKIFLPGRVDLYYWWVKNAPGHDPGTTALDHEMRHVAIHRDTYFAFKASTSDYVGVCFSKGKAECWKSVINSPLKNAYLAHNHTVNLQLDSWYQGDKIPAAIQAEGVAWDTLQKEEVKCDLMQ
jgi:RHS repeat-associated protein